MKKLVALVLALLMALSCCVALADDVTVAFSQIGQESDWRTANTDSIGKWVGEHEGWIYTYDDAQQKQENQIKALRNFITQGVDVIVLTCIVDSGWEEVLKEINDEEIPLILVDRMPDCMDKIEYYAAFGGDFVEEGRRQVAWAGEYLKTLGRGEEEVSVAIMEGTTGSGAQVGRTEGNLAAMEAYPNMKLVAQQSGNFTRAEGQALMESWLKSIDKIDVLIAQNDDMALGAIEAIKAAGLVPGKDIIIVGCDSVKAAFQAIVDGEMNATIECTPLYGPAVVQCIENLLSGVPGSKELQHPDEGVYDMDGGIDVGGVVSIKAGDVIDERVY
ncbi:MAG: ABC transporter substrate-binding protein [Clostridia bacterium]|nr:ABC transporter substrate-binding protein [Clostridia bacterium]MBR6186428.1 ABC transporter substrate-binding protein [Clostridia bacterium]